MSNIYVHIYICVYIYVYIHVYIDRHFGRTRGKVHVHCESMLEDQSQLVLPPLPVCHQPQLESLSSFFKHDLGHNTFLTLNASNKS